MKKNKKRMCENDLENYIMRGPDDLEPVDDKSSDKELRKLGKQKFPCINKRYFDEQRR